MNPHLWWYLSRATGFVAWGLYLGTRREPGDLREHASRRVSDYSLGMRQRLGLAAALLGDPRVLVLDEPANGLDPAGIAWLRGFLRALAAEGRTVLISSHVLSEVEQTVDDVVIIANGRFVRQGSMASLHGEQTSVVATTDAMSRRRFRRYWLLIGPASSLIRRIAFRLLETELRRSAPGSHYEDGAGS